MDRDAGRIQAVSVARGRVMQIVEQGSFFEGMAKERAARPYQTRRQVSEAGTV